MPYFILNIKCFRQVEAVEVLVLYIRIGEETFEKVEDNKEKDGETRKKNKSHKNQQQ